jgi:hypothetical protein
MPAWEKTNAFDLYREAESFTVYGAGRFKASYRAGTCLETGTVSWDKDSVSTVSNPDKCDTRGPTTGNFLGNEMAEFVGDAMVLSDSSYRPKGSQTRSEFFFDPFYRSLRVQGEFDGSLRAGVPTAIDLTYVNLDTRQTRTLQRFAATITPLVAVSGGVASGPTATMLVERMYSGVALAPGGTYKDTVSISPPSPGEAFVPPNAKQLRRRAPRWPRTVGHRTGHPDSSCV